MTKKLLPDIPEPVNLGDMIKWCKDLDVSYATIDNVLGKSPGTFKRYVDGTTYIKHNDFVSLQVWLRVRANALRNT